MRSISNNSSFVVQKTTLSSSVDSTTAGKSSSCVVGYGLMMVMLLAMQSLDLVAAFQVYQPNGNKSNNNQFQQSLQQHHQQQQRLQRLQTSSLSPTKRRLTYKNKGSNSAATTALLMTEEDTASQPTTFREAEILGLKYIQEGNYQDALKAFERGLKLPGSRTDILRSQSLPGPSPVGGSVGGLESREVQTLDEFELQAAYYNMACAHARLGSVDEALNALETAFQNGFDNFSTVRSDPDLDAIKKESGFVRLMEKYESKGGFNPFGFLGKRGD